METIMPAKSFWFYLESYVYVEISNNGLLLYNTMTGQYLLYYDKPHLIEFITRLIQKENLFVLGVTSDFLAEHHLEEFADDVCTHHMGDLIDAALSPKKPFIMPVTFETREPVQEPARRTLKNITPDSILTITELTFFVNTRCHSNCPACGSASGQFLWCTKEKEDAALDFPEINEILDQTKGCSIENINIIGGDLTQYPPLGQLIELIRARALNVTFYFHYDHLKNGIPRAVREAGPRFKTMLLADSSSLAIDDLPHLTQLEINGIVFMVQQEQDFDLIEKAIDRLQTPNISVQPYFNGQNLDFFKENVFTGHEDLTENILDIRTINARKYRNTLNFGKMFIKSDKNIYSSLNSEPLGKINGMTMGEAVAAELTQHGNWLLARRDNAPCHECMLNSICPPLSNFETVSGIYNSCNIRQ